MLFFVISFFNHFLIISSSKQYFMIFFTFFYVSNMQYSDLAHHIFAWRISFKKSAYPNCLLCLLLLTVESREVSFKGTVWFFSRFQCYWYVWHISKCLMVKNNMKWIKNNMKCCSEWSGKYFLCYCVLMDLWQLNLCL